MYGFKIANQPRPGGRSIKYQPKSTIILRYTRGLVNINKRGGSDAKLHWKIIFCWSITMGLNFFHKVHGTYAYSRII